MSYIRAHPRLVLFVATAALIAAVIGVFYMMLAVAVSDGAGHLSARIMLAGSVVVAIGALIVVGLSARAILADL